MSGVSRRRRRSRRCASAAWASPRGFRLPGLLPAGVLATWRVRRATDGALPVIGLGGVRTADDALQYLVAGASLVGVGTASMQDPRAPERIARDLERWCERWGVRSIADVVGTLEWPG